MPRYLVTPTLHSSWCWYMDSDQTKQDFLNTLNKVPIEPTEAMFLGRQFEDDVYLACDGDYKPSSNNLYDLCVLEAAEHARDGLRQEKVCRDIRIAGYDVLLYGKADLIRRDWIYDLKRTKNYDIGKYEGSIQHAVYMEGSGIHNFRYIVSDGRSVWLEDYHYNDAMRDGMISKIADMLDCIFTDGELAPAYDSHWLSRRRMTCTQTIYCCGCKSEVQVRLTDGSEIYPHSPDLHHIPFWKCDACKNYVGCHWKTKDRTRPLGNIPTARS
jgi:hypothetical protein